MRIPQEAINLMNEINERVSNPDKMVYCQYCKTKTASIDGSCYFWFIFR